MKRCRYELAVLVLIALAVSGGSGLAQNPASGDGKPGNGHSLGRGDGAIDVVAGDRLWIGIHQLKLDGVVVPRPSQPCLVAGRDQRCAAKAKAALAEFARGEDFRCDLLLAPSGRPKLLYNRYQAVCHAGDIDVNQDLVAQGWALAEQGAAGQRYHAAEDEARNARRGLHATTFVEDRSRSGEKAPGKAIKAIERRLGKLARAHPLFVVGMPWAIAFGFAALVLLVRWRARRKIAELQFELGRSQGLLAGSGRAELPRPRPIIGHDDGQ